MRPAVVADAPAPAKSLVGREGEGWTIAKRLLQHERAMISEMGTGGLGGRSQGLVETARRQLEAETGPLPDGVMRDEIARVELDSQAFLTTLRRSSDAAKAGKGPGAESSMFKYYGTELNKRRRALAVSVLGTQALGWEGDGFEPFELTVTRDWLRSRGHSIEGGT